MKKYFELRKRIKNALEGEKGALSTEQIVLLSVALFLATIFFLFRDTIKEFLTKGMGEIGKFSVK